MSLGVLVGATAVAVLLSESGTSVVAFFVGGLVLAPAALSLKVTRTVLIIGWTVATLLAVPLGALPYELGWHHWTWLPPESVAARFYIWKYVADRVQERSITGIGIRGTRALHLTIPTDAGDPSHAEYALRGRVARHPHNIYLQTWLELGAIGAVLLLVVGLAAIWQMRYLPPALKGSAYCAVGRLKDDPAVGIRPLAELAPCRSRLRLGGNLARGTAFGPAFLGASFTLAKVNAEKLFYPNQELDRLDK